MKKKLLRAHHKVKAPSPLVDLALFESIYKSAPIGIEIYNREGFLLKANDTVRRIFGVDDSVLNVNFNFFDDPNISNETKILLREGIETHCEILYDFELVKRLNLYPTTRSGKLHLEITVQPIHTIDENNAVGFVVHLEDISERMIAEDKAEVTHSLLQSCLESSKNVNIMAIDKSYHYVFFNSVHRASMHATNGREIKVGMNFLESIINEEQRSKVKNLFDRTFTGECLESLDEYGTNERVVLKIMFNPIYNHKQEIVGATTFAYDVTESKKATDLIDRTLKEKEVLLKEIHHRVKNNLQIIQSLLNLQSQTISDAKIRNLFYESRDRIAAIALIHEQLYCAEDLALIDVTQYLQRLLERLMGNSANENVTFTLKMKKLTLAVNIAIPCALILNELVTNCLKYAFPHGRKGLITIELTKNEDGLVVLSAADNGIGLPSELDLSCIKSFGLELVQLLAKQLHGTLEIIRSQGTKFCITFLDKGTRNE